MRIAICDDEQNEVKHLQSLVKMFDPKLTVFAYPSAEALLNSARDYDIVLLDIDMGGMDGFTAAKKLTGMQNSPLIIFITNSGEYTYRGYEVAFRYLPKPVSYEVLSMVLTAAIAHISPQKLTITENGRTHIINIKDILYFESSGHDLIVYTTKNIYEYKMKLSEVEALLPTSVFAVPHKGYLVNLDYVDSLEFNSLLLTNKMEIPVSRRQKREFEKALSGFVRI
jgi:DNA-binding LytR/AlgR family response regulator